MADSKSKLPDFNELKSMGSKLFHAIKNSVGEIVDDYKKKRESTPPTTPPTVTPDAPKTTRPKSTAKSTVETPVTPKVKPVDVTPPAADEITPAGKKATKKPSVKTNNTQVGSDDIE